MSTQELMPPTKYADPTIALLRSQLAQLQIVEQMYIAQKEHGERLEEVARTAEAALAVARDNLGYFTLMGYARRHGLEMSAEEAPRHGKKLTALCASRGVKPGKLDDPRYGYVNTYPESVLSDYFSQNAPSPQN